MKYEVETPYEEQVPQPEQEDHSFYQAETEGRILFICRLFITFEGEVEDWRRTTVFRSMEK